MIKKISNLKEGERFRPAAPGQVSLNKKQMSRQIVYTVKRVYAVSPFYTIAQKGSGRDGVIYSLHPDTPIVSFKTPTPSERELALYYGKKTTNPRRVVGYRMTWSGEPGTESVMGKGIDVATLKTMFSVGLTEFVAREAMSVIGEHHATFWPGPKSSAVVLWNRFKVKAISVGILVEILEEKESGLEKETNPERETV